MALVVVSATSAGCTNSTYASGDMLGTIWSFTSAVATSGGYGYVVGAVLEDDANVLGAVDIVFFNATVSQAADNAAASWSDADAQLSEGSISLPAPLVYALNRVSSWEGAKPFKCAATTLFAGFITRTNNAAIPSATALHCKLYIDQQ